MTCQEVIDLMNRQLDGDLDERETELLMNHTRNCPDCAEMLERLSRLSSELENLPKVTPSYSLVDAIMPRLEQIELERKQEEEQTAEASVLPPEQQPRRSAPSRNGKGWLSRYRLLGGIAAAGIVAGVFILSYSPSTLPTAMESSAPLAMQHSAANAPASAGEGSNVTKLSASDASNSPSEEDGLDGSSPDESTTGKAKEEAAESSPSADREQLNIIAHQDQAGGAVEDTHKNQKLVTPSSPPAPDATPKEYSSVDQRSAGDSPGATEEKRSADLSNHAASDESPGGGARDMPPTYDAPEAARAPKAPDMSFEPEVGASLLATPTSSSDSAGAASPNGAYHATVNGKSVEIYNASTSELLFRGGEKQGDISNLYWAEDNQTVSYEVSSSDGTVQHYVIHVNDGTEIKQEP